MHLVDNAADTCEFPQVCFKTLLSWEDTVIRCDREVITVLSEVVTNRDFATERITAVCHIQFLQIIWESLYQNRFPQTGKLDCIRNSALITKIWQTDEDTVDLISMAFEQFGTFLCMCICRDSAVYTRVFIQRYIIDSQFFQYGKHLFSGIENKTGREKFSRSK